MDLKLYRLYTQVFLNFYMKFAWSLANCAYLEVVSSITLCMQ